MSNTFKIYPGKQTLALCAMFFCALFCGKVLATQPEETVTINMRNAEINAVIQWIAEQTNKKIIIDPRVKGKVSILANTPMSIEHAYHVFTAMLEVYGYALIENDEIVRVIPTSAAKASPSSIIADFKNNQGSQQALYVYESHGGDLQKLSAAIRPLVGNAGHITPIPDTNKLIIADAYDNIKRLVQLISQIDTQDNITIKSIALQHASASTVAAVINSLLEKQNQQTFTIASDERSNSLLMTGDAVIERRVRQLVSQLDRPIINTDTTKVIYLHYTDAAELLPILTSMASSIKEENKNHKIQQQAVSVSASDSTNALIITAPPDILYAMEKVVDQLDIKRAQVLVEAIIVEVSEELAQTIGVEWNTSFSAGTGTEAATNFGLRSATNENALISAGLSLGYYSNGSLRALINALATNVDANILSTPSLLTLDNQEAEILVGSNVPFITGQTRGSNNENSDPFTTIEREDIGLTLKVKPQINNSDDITLEIIQELETITDSVDAASDIVTNKRSIKTKVLVKNENILVLGGLITDEDREVVNKVPLLGDVPLLGSLFRSTTTRTSQRNLMIFIHPKIMANEADLELLSSQKYQDLQKLRAQYKK